MTAMRAALESAELSADDNRLRSAISYCVTSEEPELALWLRLVRDKDLSIIAMRILIDREYPGRPLSDVSKHASAPQAVRPVRPSCQTRALVRSEAANVALRAVSEIVKSAFEFELGEGRQIGDYMVHELTKLREARGLQFRVANDVLAAIPTNADPFSKVRENIKEVTLSAIIRNNTVIKPR